MNRQPTPRLLTTSARVHPPYLPYLHTASRSTGRSLRWLPPLAVVVSAGYAVSAYRSTQLGAGAGPLGEAEQQQQHQQHHQQQQAAAEAMAEAYGDRGSLEELERAMALYEAQRGSR